MTTHWHISDSMMCRAFNARRPVRHEWSLCTSLGNEPDRPVGPISCRIEEVDCEECLRRYSLLVLCDGSNRDFERAVRGW